MSKSKKKPTINQIKTIKTQLLLRTANIKCTYCNLKIKEVKNFTIDHVVPLAMGGTNELNNIAICCPTCNRRKKDMLLTQFIRAYDIKITKEIDKFL